MDNAVLVTGGAGFLGMSIAKELKKLGYILYGIGHNTPEQGLYDFWYSTDITFSNLKKIQCKLSVIIHCGGGSSVLQSTQEPLIDFNKTVCASMELLEYVRLLNANAKVIYVSSAAVYGVQPNIPIVEDSVKSIASPYGLHKYCAEELFTYYKKNYGINIVITRFFSVYGPGLKKQLLWDVYNKLNNFKGNHIEFWGTGLETRDWIYIEDVIELFVKLIRVEELPEVINVGSGTAITICEVISIVYRILNKIPNFIFNNQSRPGDPKYYLADISKAKSLDWKPKVSFYKGVEHYIKWVKNEKI